nr:hypothetical protein [Lysobacter enzymogenes]
MSLRSEVGRGTAFGVRVAAVRVAQAPLLAGARLPVCACSWSTTTRMLAALAETLKRWGCDVATAADDAGARAALRAAPAQLWLFDFHLDRDDTGLALAARLRPSSARGRACCSAPTAARAGARGGAGRGRSLLAKPVKPLALKSVLDRLLAAAAAAG